MIHRTTDLPLSRDASSRFLPWLIAFMVYLAALALAATMVLSGASTNWRHGLEGTLTVQILPGMGDGAALTIRVESALRLLRATPGVESAEAITPEQAADLLEPWLGKGGLAAELPLPRLIDVRLATGAAVDPDALAARLAAEVPGAELDDHGLWIDRVIALVGAIEIVAMAVMAVIVIAAIATLVFATRTGLVIHHDVIELLHMIGARDGYIASQFQMHSLWLGLKGGLIGLALAVVTLTVLSYLGRQIEATLMPPLTLSVAQWAALASLAAFAALISMVAARITVMRALARMM
ncbi:MAG: cell division protein FtsX [Alphaproteobacteria bacterium]